MKRLFFVLIGIIAIQLFTACNKEDASAVSDPVLIEDIANATNKVLLSPDELPTVIQNEVEENYFETYIESAAKVEGKGYEIILGSEDVIYAGIDGVELRSTGFRRGRPHRPGPCGFGHRIPVDSLPTVITEYISTEYPDAEIKAAKERGDGYLVLLNGHRLLAFKLDGELIEATFAFRHCNAWWGHRLNIDNLPDPVTSYIADNYANSEIKLAGKMRNGNIVVAILYDGGRKIVVFDENGAFLFDRG